MLIACLAVTGLAVGQTEEIIFKEGLAIRNVGQRAPLAVFADHVLAHFQAKGWKSPNAGDSVTDLDGNPQAWQPIHANSDGTFNRAPYSRGWAYFEFESPKPRIMLLRASGCGAVYADGRPRASDHHAYGYVRLPVKLRKGKTSFMFAPGREPLKASLVSPPAPLFLNPGDATLPDILVGRPQGAFAGVVVVNATESFRKGLKLTARIADGNLVETSLPSIPSLSHRKVPIALQFPTFAGEGEAPLQLTLMENGKQIDTLDLSIRIRRPDQTRKVTFKSEVDGSVQYYAVNPAQTPGDGKPLVMALHGARTEGLEMADDYKGKDWCHIVCATNRRPFGFDWEDIGRLDMLEVLALAKAELKTDPERTYLTGHSMGGHGAWINGLLFPDKWAAVAPCAAWASIFGYWPRSTPKSPQEEVMYRAGNPSDTHLLRHNALHFPIYMHHGDKDEDVDYSESLRMHEELKSLGHTNLTLHTMPGGGHWFGTESIDWPGIFGLFRDLKLTANIEKNSVDFSTVNLPASSQAWWLEILQQEQPIALSRARFERKANRIVGTTENIAAIALHASAFQSSTHEVEIDGQTFANLAASSRIVFQKIDGNWKVIPALSPGERNPRQAGPFKEVFKNRFRFVFGTKGTRQEAEDNLTLARFHAEDFQVLGNGSIELLSDRDFLREPSKGVDQTNIILFGNEDTNLAWSRLLPNSPIRVHRGRIQAGKEVYSGKDLACLFVRPMSGSETALVGVLGSTGHLGHSVLERLPLFLSGAHFPDWTIVGADMYTKGIQAVRAAGYFDNRWQFKI